MLSGGQPLAYGACMKSTTALCGARAAALDSAMHTHTEPLSSVTATRFAPGVTGLYRTVCLCSSRPLCDVPVHMLVESQCYIRMHSDRECIFCEYLVPVAAREERAVARARGVR